jgi:putative endopeptidase
MKLILLLSFVSAIASAAPGVDTGAMNRSIDPCVDFYEYACGNWRVAHPLPADKARFGRFEELLERNQSVLLDLVQGAVQKGASASAIERKIADYYSACMDTAGIEKRALAALKPELDRIAALSSEEAIMEQIGRLHAMAVPVVFRFGAAPDAKDSTRTIATISQSGLSLPDRDYYLNSGPNFVQVREKYHTHLAKVFGLLGAPADAVARQAALVVAFETVIAKASLDRTALRDPVKRYRPMTKAQLAVATPEVPWDDYFATVGAPPFDTVNVSAADFLQTVAVELRSQPMEAWRAYFTYHLVHEYAAQLPAAFEQEDFDFHQRAVAGTPSERPRTRRCIEGIDRHLGDLLGQRYVEVAFGGTSRQQIVQMVDALEKAMARDIRSLTWMTDETKKAALEKLRSITNNVGTPLKWRDYSAVTIAPDDHLGNVLRAERASGRRQLAKIGKPTDKTEWMMTTPTVNAFYSPAYNSINFPAGIMGTPFFDAQRDIATNYGSMGAVIGHELTHGFDDSGRKYDGNGNLRDWWTARDGQEFEKRVACVANQFSNFTAVDDLKLNGKFTLGENTADLGGVRIALMALQDTLQGKSDKVDGFTPEQRFFLGFAQVWCQNTRPEESRRRVTMDPHSPGRFRVNGTYQNLEEFQKAFSCKAGQPMVSANACRVW